MRPVNLGVQFRDGGRIVHDGRLTDPTNELRFTIDPDRQEIDNENQALLIERVSIDISTASTPVVPRITTEVDAFVLDSISLASRETVVYEVNRLGNLTDFRLEGDFTNAIAIYGVEITMRPLTLGVSVLEGG